MNANTLRIGNYVNKQLKSGNGRTIVDEIGCQDIVRIFEDTGFFIYEPILIDENWLLDFGFTKGNICYDEAYSKDVLQTDFYLRPSCYGGFYWGFNISDKKMDCELDDVQPIKYVHELQNLIFAITGEEL